MEHFVLQYGHFKCFLSDSIEASVFDPTSVCPRAMNHCVMILEPNNTIHFCI